MRIDKKKLREILVGHCRTAIVQEKPWTLEHLEDLLRRGRRTKGCKWPRTYEYLVRCVERTFRDAGYEVDNHNDKDQVSVKMFSWGGDNTWIHIPKDIAEKIIVFQTVPNMRK